LVVLRNAGAAAEHWFCAALVVLRGTIALLFPGSIG
jgi:hypothetical protein